MRNKLTPFLISPKGETMGRNTTSMQYFDRKLLLLPPWGKVGKGVNYREEDSTGYK
jgi:hypothetical protein